MYAQDEKHFSIDCFGIAAGLNSDTMHIALHAANTFTRDAMNTVAGSYGTHYFDDLQNGTATFSDAFTFLGADIATQFSGEVGGVALGFTAGLAGEVLPSVGRNWASMFGDTQVNALSPMRLRVMHDIAESQAGNISNFSIHALTEEIPHLDVRTALDEATFWSGRGNRVLAENFASHTGGLTLEMTPGGKYLESLRLFSKYDYEQARIPWARLSERFAQNASGEVSAFTVRMTSKSIFNTVELPVLLRNPKVTNIVYSPQFQSEKIFDLRR